MPDQPKDPKTPSNPPDEPTPSAWANLTGARWWGAFIFAAVVFVLFAVLGGVLVALANNSDTEELIWQRYIYVFAAAEAIAFVAVGWVFGKEVHRGEAETAKDEAQAERDRADATTDAAIELTGDAAAADARFEALRTAVLSLTESPDFRAARGLSYNGNLSSDMRLSALRQIAEDFES